MPNARATKATIPKATRTKKTPTTKPKPRPRARRPVADVEVRTAVKPRRGVAPFVADLRFRQHDEPDASTRIIPAPAFKTGDELIAYLHEFHEWVYVAGEVVFRRQQMEGQDPYGDIVYLLLCDAFSIFDALVEAFETGCLPAGDDRDEGGVKTVTALMAAAKVFANEEGVAASLERVVCALGRAVEADALGEQRAAR